MADQDRKHILIADDSPTMRAFLSRVLAREPRFRVLHAVSDGTMVIDAVQAGGVDALVLDVEMPRLNGLEALDRIREINPKLPVVMFSAHTGRGSRAAIAALASGADDLVTKPSVDVPGRDREIVGEELLAKLRALLFDGTRLSNKRTDQISREMLEVRRAISASPGVLALAASTGGPSAIETVLGGLPEELPVPIVIAQHMPGGFTAHLAERLDGRVAPPVVEAQQGSALEAGHVYIAPGDHHLRVLRHGGRDYLELSAERTRSGVMPSADVLFRSVADVFGPRATAVVLTGMGRDGLAGARAVRRVGGVVIAQDESTSTVWGMPGQVVGAGLANDVLPLPSIADALLSRLAVVQRSGTRRSA